MLNDYEYIQTTVVFVLLVFIVYRAFKLPSLVDVTVWFSLRRRVLAGVWVMSFRHIGVKVKLLSLGVIIRRDT